MKQSKRIIGRTDVADFPLLKIKNIRVKIDSGAFTSSMHCHKISVVNKNGVRLLKFYLLDPSHPKYEAKALYSKKFKQKKIKSSNGSMELRYVIQSSIKLFKQNYPLELSLTDRGGMKYPVLLGRKFLMSKFIIDVSKYNLSSKAK